MKRNKHLSSAQTYAAMREKHIAEMLAHVEAKTERLMASDFTHPCRVHHGPSLMFGTELERDQAAECQIFYLGSLITQSRSSSLTKPRNFNLHAFCSLGHVHG